MLATSIPGARRCTQPTWVTMFARAATARSSTLTRALPIHTVACVILVVFNALIGVWPMVAMNVVLADGAELKVDKIIGRDPKTDITLLKVTPKASKPLSAVPFGDSGKMRVGDWDTPEGKQLLIDDSPLALDTVSSFLDDMGWTVLSAQNGSEALQTASVSDLDAVIADLNMPDMNGYALTEKIRSISPEGHIPILAVTANTRPRDTQGPSKSGCDAYIQKPIDIPLLSRVILHWSAVAHQRAGMIAVASTEDSAPLQAPSLD